MLLLPGKLAVPRVKKHHLPRPRLAQQLVDDRAPGAILLLAAPAGYGKTSLLAECCAQSATPVAWLTLGCDDNLPATFVAYLGAALDAICPGLRAALDARLMPGLPAADTLKLLVAMLHERLAPAGESGALLVLDGLEAAETGALRGAIAFVLDNLPPLVRVALSGRAVHGLPLARWRVDGRLREVRCAELCFTPEETTRYLDLRLPRAPSPGLAGALHERTAGWVAATLLFADELAGAAHAEQYVRQAPLPRALSDYLRDELLERQARPVQRFLQATAILTRLDGDIADALTERQDSAALLARLAAAGFAEATGDQDGTPSRYHPLVREFLLRRPAQPAAELRRLHRRAARWYAQHRRTEDAIDHLLAAGDVDECIALLSGEALALVRRGRLGRLRDWVARLPLDRLLAEPGICLALIWLLLDRSEPAAATPYLEQLSAGELAQSPALGVERTVLEALILAMTGRAAEAVRLAQLARNDGSDEDPVARALIAFGLGAAYKMSGDSAPAAYWFRHSAVIATSLSWPYLAAAALGNLANLLHDLARLPEAEALYMDALRMAASEELEPAWSGWLHWDLGRIYFEWNRLERAMACADRAVALCRRWGNSAMVVYSLILRSRIYQASGQLPEAHAALDEAEGAAYVAAERSLIEAVHRRRLVLALAERDVQTARLLAAGLDAGTSRNVYAPAATTARLALAEGQPHRAIEALEPALAQLEQTGLVAWRVQLLVVHALACRAAGQPDRALRQLGSALELAAGGRLVRSIVDAGAGIGELLKRAAAASDDPAHIAVLLAALPEAADAPAERPRLSQRELQVMRMLASGLSNAEMAASLRIADATLKRHVSNLYLKLDVHSRTQAVARAHALGLLELHLAAT